VLVRYSPTAPAQENKPLTPRGSTDSLTPYCTSIVLEDKRSVSLVGCFNTRTQFKVYATPLGQTTPPTTQPGPTTPTPIPTPTPTPTPSPTPNNDNPTPVGAIVGGVVGGLAVIAIAGGLIAWLVLRRRRQSGPAPVPQPVHTGGPGGPGGQPPMSAYPAGSHVSYMSSSTAPVDPRYGVGLKSPQSMYSSTVGSPGPGSDPSSPGFAAAFATQPPSHLHQQTVPPSGPVHPYHQPGQYTAELPAERQT